MFEEGSLRRSFVPRSARVHRRRLDLPANHARFGGSGRAADAHRSGMDRGFRFASPPPPPADLPAPAPHRAAAAPRRVARRSAGACRCGDADRAEPDARRRSWTSIASSMRRCGRCSRSGGGRSMPMSSRSRSTAIRYSGARRGPRERCWRGATARAGARSCLPGPTAAPRAGCRAARRTSLAVTLARIAELMDRREDVLVLYTTGHGAPLGLYYNDADSGYGLISPNRLGGMLDELGLAQPADDPFRLLFGRVRAAAAIGNERDRHRRVARPHLLRLRGGERLDLLRRRDDQPRPAQPAAARRRFRRGEQADRGLGDAGPHRAVGCRSSSSAPARRAGSARSSSACRRPRRPAGVRRWRRRRRCCGAADPRFVEAAKLSAERRGRPRAARLGLPARDETWGDPAMGLLLAALALITAAAPAAQPRQSWHLIEGTLEPNRGPGRQFHLPRRARRADPGRYRAASGAPGPAARLCAGARAADRGDRQHPLASRSHHRQWRGPRRLSARAGLCEQCDRGRADRLPRPQPRFDRAAARRRPDPGGESGRSPPRLRSDGSSGRAAADPPGDALGRAADRRAAAAGEPRALCGDRGRRLALRSGVAAGHRRRSGRGAGAVHGHGLPGRLAARARRDRRDAASPP